MSAHLVRRTLCHMHINSSTHLWVCVCVSVYYYKHRLFCGRFRFICSFRCSMSFCFIIIMVLSVYLFGFYSSIVYSSFCVHIKKYFNFYGQKIKRITNIYIFIHFTLLSHVDVILRGVNLHRILNKTTKKNNCVPNVQFVHSIGCRFDWTANFRADTKTGIANRDSWVWSMWRNKFSICFIWGHWI